VAPSVQGARGGMDLEWTGIGVGTTMILIGMGVWRQAGRCRYDPGLE